jgi:hypothetical protein
VNGVILFTYAEVRDVFPSSGMGRTSACPLGQLSYNSSEYAGSMGKFGTPRELPTAGGHLIARQIGGSGVDAMGPYPLFQCRDWSLLGADLAELAEAYVSVALVPDPLSCPTTSDLALIFDIVRPFKRHHICDLSSEPESYITKHHRYYARRALRYAEVVVAEDPTTCVDEWTSLYQVLVARHGLRGLKAFSREAFGLQLAVPGAVLFRLVAGGHCVGAHIWYVCGDTAYSHLMALNDEGYAMEGSYALYWKAIESFGKGVWGPVRLLHLGGGAGAGDVATDGLARFKSGWANDSRTAYFCGSILNRAEYARLVTETGTQGASYFPAYRAGELL